MSGMNINGNGNGDNGGDMMTWEDADDFRIVKEYLLNCPYVTRTTTDGGGVETNPAIKAALDGLEKEMTRRERDARLQKKFAASTSTSAAVSAVVASGTPASTTSSSHNSVTSEGDVVVVVGGGNSQPDTKQLSHNNNSDGVGRDMDTTDDWQDVSVSRQSQESPSGLSASGIGLDENPTSSNSSSYLGKVLAQTAVTTLAKYNVRVNSPAAALAAAFHACLRSDGVGFSCTGLPDDPSSSSGGLGFAPPIRELPKNQFLPSRWETTKPNTSTNVSLRYRKNGTGAIILTVDAPNNDSSTYTEATVTVRFAPANSNEPSATELVFPLGHHFNTDSWEAAKSNVPVGTPLSPSLHYKALATMLSQFCQTFDLGGVMENDTLMSDATTTTMMMGDDSAGTSLKKMKSEDGNGFITTTTAGPPPLSVLSPPTDLPPTGTAQAKPTNMGSDGRIHFPNKDDKKMGGTDTNKQDDYDGQVPSTLDQAFPATNGGGMVQPGGDFAGDLLPAGLQDPRFAGRVGGGSNNGRMGGNMMGPNHPMFNGDPTMIGGGGMGGGVGGPPIGGPGSMQPRFDPFYPPGIDGSGNGDVPNVGGGPGSLRRPGNNTKKPNRASLRGEPNPDHLPPPNSFGGGGHDMFM